MRKGIDLSEHNERIDYDGLGVEFAILREGCALRMDYYFQRHTEGFRDAGVPIIGVYHFIYATTPTGAKAEAESCIRNIEALGYDKTTRIWADFEYDTVDKAAQQGIVLGPAECDSVTRAFCETVEAHGYPTGIYANQDYLDNMYSPETIARYPLWLCDLSGKSRDCLVHQYSWEPYDMDYYFEEMEMSTVERAISWMEALARDDSHGYDQAYRWGERGDYDCSSAVITAWKQAGVPLESTYTGNMKADMLRHGFVDVTGQALKRGDVLLNETHHVAMYCGDGMEVEASANERGGATGGTPGDQTGREILIRSYRDYPWDCILRYQSVEEVVYTIGVSTVKQGAVSSSARLLQTLLKGLGYTGIAGAGLSIDGDAGAHTDHAIREYQADHGLEVDGECGKNTWRSIIGI